MKATPSFRSSLPNIAWPAVPGPEAARVLAILFQLDKSQWWTPEQIEENQFSQLTKLLRHAYRTIPFYRTRLDSVGWDPRVPLTPQLYRQIPILAREDIQEVGDGLISHKLPRGHGKVSFAHTSGSTGKPIRVAKCGASGLFLAGLHIA